MFRQETVPGGEMILTVAGAVTGETNEDFGRRLSAIADGRWTTITLDLSQTPAMSSASIGKLLAFRKKLADQNKTLRIHGCSDSLYRVFQLIKLESLIPIEH